VQKIFWTVLFVIGVTTMPAFAGVKEVPVRMGQSFRYEDFQVHVVRVEWRAAQDGSGKGQLVTILDMTCLHKSDPPGAPSVDIRIEHKDGTFTDDGSTIGDPPDKVGDIDATLAPFEKGQEGMVAFVSTEIAKPTPADPLTLTFVTGNDSDTIHYNLKNPPIIIN